MSDIDIINVKKIIIFKNVHNLVLLRCLN